MADDRDDSTRHGEHAPLPIAIEGISDGAEFFIPTLAPDRTHHARTQGGPTTPERAQALGVFVEEACAAQLPLEALQDRHLLPALSEELIGATRYLVSQLHSAARGDATALSYVRAAVRARGTVPNDTTARRAALVHLLEGLRKNPPDSREWIAELVGLDSRGLGQGDKAFALLPGLLKVPTSIRAAARLSVALGLFGDDEREEDDAGELFRSAVKKTQKRRVSSPESHDRQNRD